MKLVRMSLYPALLAAVVMVATCAPALARGSKHQTAFPNPWSLIAKAGRAMTRAGSAHGVGASRLATETKTSKGLKAVVDTGVFAGDAMTIQPGRSHIVVNGVQSVGSKSVSVTYNYVTVGKKIATENKAAKWICHPMSLLNKIPEWTPTEFALGINKAKGETARTTASLIFHGAKVWQVLVKSQSKKIHGRGVIDLLIDQKTDLVRDTTTLNTWTANGEPWSESLALALTKFGEPVRATLPAGC